LKAYLIGVVPEDAAAVGERFEKMLSNEALLNEFEVVRAARDPACQVGGRPFLYRKMTEFMQMIGNLRGGKEQAPVHVHDPSRVGKIPSPRPRKDNAASRAGVCFVDSSWYRNSIRRRYSSLGAR
jgi:hypothetical protein